MNNKMKKLVILTVFFIFLFITSAFAETTIKAEMDKTSITTDETLIYKIIVTSSDKNLPAVQLPKFTGFNIISQAESSTVSFAQSDTKTILVYTLILIPADIGKFKIEPAVIKIKNKAYSTDTFEIEVAQGNRKPEIPPEESLPKESPTESEQPQVTL